MELVDTSNSLAAGEDVSTTSLRDAQHWSDFYRELSSFQQTLRRLKRKVRGFTGERRTEAVKQALPDLISDCENFERRFAFWERRLAELS